MQKVLLIFFLTSYICNAQSEFEKIEEIRKKSREFFLNNNDSSLFYNQKALIQAKRIQVDTLVSKVYFDISQNYYNRGDYIEWEKYLERSEEIAKNNKFWKIVVLGKYIRAEHMYDQGFQNESIKAFQNVFELAIKRKIYRYLPDIKTAIATVYSDLNMPQKALVIYKEAINLGLKYDEFALNYIYNNLGEEYIGIDYDSALFYLKKGLKLSRKLNNKYLEGNLYLNLGNANLVYKKYDSANYFLQRSLKHGVSFEDNGMLYYTYFHLGQLYEAKKEYEEAIQYYSKALAIEDDFGVDVHQKIIVYKSLAMMYSDLKQYNKAYQFQEKHQVLKDSIFNIDKAFEFTKIRTEYEVETKNQQIELLTSEKEVEALRKRQLIYGGIGIGIPLFLLILFYRNRVKSQRLLQEKEKQRYDADRLRLEKENELEQTTSLLAGQDQERNRIAQEIHDGVGAQLAGLKLNLEQTNHILKDQNITNITDDLGRAFGELRSISHNLSLNYIQEKDLKILLLDLKHKAIKNHGIQMELYVFPDDLLTKFSITEKHHVYRTAQELLQNTYKHAMASQVHLSFTKHEDEITFLFEDDGNGFDTKNATKGIGLQNIDERVKTLNGTLVIDSQLERGTTCIITLPNKTII